MAERKRTRGMDADLYSKRVHENNSRQIARVLGRNKGNPEMRGLNDTLNGLVRRSPKVHLRNTGPSK